MKTARCYPVNKWAKNIKECYQSATEKDKADGGAWYDNVRARCEKWAAEFGRNVETVAGEVDITPRELQAITWTHYRRNLERKYSEMAPF